MKKNYENPLLDILHPMTCDIVTLSVGIASENMGDDNENGERAQAWRYE